MKVGVAMTPQEMISAALEVQKLWGSDVQITATGLLKVVDADGKYLGWIESRNGVVRDGWTSSSSSPRAMKKTG